MYGEFVIETKMPSQIINVNFLNPNEEEELNKIQNALNPKANLIAIHENELKNEEVMQYLVAEGFVINRHDINDKTTLYRQLTDRGRELKQCGTIEAYKELSKQKLEAIAADVARQATERQRSDNEYERNYYLFWITAAIAISTALQGAWNLMELVRNYYNPFLPLMRYLIPAIVIFLLYIVIRILWLKVRQPQRRK